MINLTFITLIQMKLSLEFVPSSKRKYDSGYVVHGFIAITSVPKEEATVPCPLTP